jgi:hypothetical protein
MIRLNNVGVDQVGDELCLTDEIFDEHFLARVVGPDDLDCHPLDEIARTMLFSFIDDPHTALKNLADDVVTKLVLDAEQRHRHMVGNRLAKSSPTRVTPRKTLFFLIFSLARNAHWILIRCKSVDFSD